MCKITLKTSVLLHPVLQSHFLLLLVMLTLSLLPLPWGYALDPPFLVPLPRKSALFQRNQNFACGMPVKSESEIADQNQLHSLNCTLFSYLT